jgi:hypothetical protein
MAHRIFAVALSMIAATSAVSAQPEPIPAGAPSASADARYCLRVAPVTGSLVETVQCWTRAEWWEQDVDVDKEWAKEGVEVLS